MSFTPKQFLLLYFIVAIFLVFIFAFARRKPQQPTKLKMKSHSSTGYSSMSLQNQSKGAFMTQSHAVDKANENNLTSLQNSRDPQKDLNVIFIYNGHSWDAFEVLGLPAGSSLQAVRDCHAKTVREAGNNPVDFFNAALLAIEEKFKGR